MKQKTIVLIIAIFSFIVIGMFGFAYLKKTELAENNPSVPLPQEEIKYASITRVDAKHFFIDGVHTIAGEILMPTPCDLLESNATVAESDPEQITINFTVINNAENCAQVITPARFMVSAIASSDAIFSATLEGREIELNLIPAAPGETLEAFEIFIKG